jgi:hypothetical protein
MPGSGKINAMRATAVAREDGKPPRSRSSVTGFLTWAFAMAAIAISIPYIVLQAQPKYSSPWWSTWLPIGFWLMSFTWGLAWVVAGGRFRKVGAALILGDVVGAAAFLYWVLWSYAHVSGGWG